jgi:hypothetical protein
VIGFRLLPVLEPEQHRNRNRNREHEHKRKFRRLQGSAYRHR